MLLSTLILGGLAVYVIAKAYRTGKAVQVSPWPAARHPSTGDVVSASQATFHASDRRAQLGQNFAAATVTLGLATTSLFIYPPLALICIPGLLYLSIPTVQTLYDAVAYRTQARTAVIDAVVITGALATGQYVAISLHFWLRELGDKQRQTLQNGARAQFHSMVMPSNPRGWTQATDLKQASFTTMMEHSIVAIQPGEVIPVDGVIIEGVAIINEQNLTRLAKPSTRMVGDPVFASTILLAGKVNVKIVREDGATAAVQLNHLLTHAEDSAVACQTQSEEIAAKLTVPLLSLGTLAALLLGPSQAAALLNARLGYDRDALVTTKALTYLNLARQQGILIKDCQVLQTLADVDTVLFDIDTTRHPDIGQAILELRQHQVPYIYLLSPARASYATRLAERVGIDAVYRVVTPDDSIEILERLVTEGRRVCYVHTGHLDERLAQRAVVTVAVGDIAATVAPAQVVLLANDFTQLGCLLDLGRKFAAECRHCEQLTFWPGVISMASTLFLGTGLLASVLLNDLGVIVGAGQLDSLFVPAEPPKNQTDAPGSWQALVERFDAFNIKAASQWSMV